MFPLLFNTALLMIGSALLIPLVGMAPAVGIFIISIVFMEVK